jgi:hypothetical protein
MFGDFNWKETLMAIDNLIRDKKYGTYVELINLTMREVADIFKVILSKEQEQQLNQALSNQM